MSGILWYVAISYCIFTYMYYEFQISLSIYNILKSDHCRCDSSNICNESIDMIFADTDTLFS